jgi:hypothetical protein
MKARMIVVLCVTSILALCYVSLVPSQPSFNGATPGCTGGGCHTRQAGLLTVTPQGNLQVKITVGTATSVAGELVDGTGTVVAVNDGPTNNGFVLTAPSAGRYRVDAGYKSPSMRWDSLTVNITLTDVESSKAAHPGAAYALDQNYPNPFNPSTVIPFTVSRSGFVTLAVYNTLGQEVAQLVNGQLEAGFHEVTFQGSGLVSGVYLYQLRAGDFVATKKLLVLK